MPANIVVGQTNFTSNSANQGGSATATTLSFPRRLFIINNKLFVADEGNNRVLIWNTIPNSMSTPADVVIGQPNMSSTSVNQGGSVRANTLNGPTSIGSDGSKLFVTDGSNRRVLIFNQIPTTNNASADVVIGQPNMTTVNNVVTQTSTKIPYYVHFDPDSGKLIVTDASSLANRVLIYNQVPTTNGVSADVVLGQPDFTSGSANQGGSPTARTLNGPESAVVINGILYVADLVNSRILGWRSIPTTSNAPADFVLGQQNFTSNSANQGGTPSGTTLSFPSHVAYDGVRFFISDYNNHRVLIYKGLPTSTLPAADQVLGQPSFSAIAANQGGAVAANTLKNPLGIFVYNNILYVSEQQNHRILKYNNILSGPLLSLNSITTGTNGKLVATGNIQIGERGTYGLQKMEASVNGEGYTNVTSKDGGTDDGTTGTRYLFTHEFSPWVSNGTPDNWTERGYTLKLRATSLNAEEDTLFHSDPFTLNAVTGSILPTFTFTVNKYQWNRLKDNLDSYEVSVKKDGTNEWSTYLEKIPVNASNFVLPLYATYNETDGIITVRSTSKTLATGKYTVKLVAKDKWNHRQDSNELKYTSLGGASYKPNLPITTEWFPIQITKIAGISTNIISNFNPVILPTYTARTSYPTFTGVAFNNATVTMQVTDTKSGKSRKYETIVKNSIWKLTPTLYSSSIVDVWVTDGNGRYNELPPLIVTVSNL